MRAKTSTAAPGRRPAPCAAVAAVLFSALVPAAGAATFTVTSSADSGVGTLRAAISAANANAGMDTIAFNIGGSGPHTIAVSSALPGITDPVLIDGYTQPGAAVNTAGIGSNAQIMIELRSASGSASGSLALLVGSAGSTIRGLAINRFTSSLINVTAGTSDCVIAGNFIGTNPAGTQGYPNATPGTQTGVSLAGDGCRLGGSNRADRNIVSGLSGTGVYVSGDNVVVQGNLIGTDAIGLDAIPNSTGVLVGATPPGGPTLDALIGGVNSGVYTPRNVISGNHRAGVQLRAGNGHKVLGNFIGLIAAPLFGDIYLANGGAGVLVTGGTWFDIGSMADDGGKNLIGGNDGPGVLISGPADNAAAPQGMFVGANNFLLNGGLAVDLSLLATGDDVTANDALDADAGPNRRQNFPVLTEVDYPAGETRVHGLMQSTAGTSFRIELYTTATCDPSGHGWGATFRGSATVVTDAAGNGSFEMSFPGEVLTGFATATAAHNSDLASSEFSACLALGLGDAIFRDGFED